MKKILRLDGQKLRAACDRNEVDRYQETGKNGEWREIKKSGEEFWSYPLQTVFMENLSKSILISGVSTNLTIQIQTHMHPYRR